MSDLQLEKIEPYNISSTQLFIKNAISFGQYIFNDKLITILGEDHNVQDSHCNPTEITYGEYITKYSKNKKKILIELPRHTTGRAISMNMHELLINNPQDFILIDIRAEILTEDSIHLLYHFDHVLKGRMNTLSKQYIQSVNGYFTELQDRYYSTRILDHINSIKVNLIRSNYNDRNFTYLSVFIDDIIRNLVFLIRISTLLYNIISGIKSIDKNSVQFTQLISDTNTDITKLQVGTPKQQIMEIFFKELQQTVSKLADLGIILEILKQDDVKEIFCIIGNAHFLNFNTFLDKERVFISKGVNNCIDVTESFTLSNISQPTSSFSKKKKNKSIKRKSIRKKSIKRKSIKRKSIRRKSKNIKKKFNNK